MSGHGHVVPNPNGMKARCGGPAMCSTCAAELAQHTAAQNKNQAAAATGMTGDLTKFAPRPAKHPFDYHRPSPGQVDAISVVRTACKELHAVLSGLPPGRERAVAITKLEEVSMWANKAIIMADEGEVDNGTR